MVPAYSSFFPLGQTHRPPKSPVTFIIPFEKKEERERESDHREGKLNFLEDKGPFLAWGAKKGGEKSFRREREEWEGLTALMQSGYYLSNPAVEMFATFSRVTNGVR